MPPHQSKLNFYGHVTCIVFFYKVTSKYEHMNVRRYGQRIIYIYIYYRSRRDYPPRKYEIALHEFLLHHKHRLPSTACIPALKHIPISSVP